MLIVRTAVLCCVLTLATSAVLAQAASQPASKHGTTSAPKSKAKQNQSTPGLDTSSLEKTIREVVKEASEKHDPHADAHLQSEGHLVEYTRQLAVDTNRLAKFTLWLFAVTGLMVLVVAGQLWMFKRQLGLMEADSKITRDAALAAKSSADASLLSIRPWLSCEVKAMEPLSFNEAGDPIFKFRITVRNVGQTPAMSVRMSHELHICAPGVPATPLRLQLLTWLARGLGVQRPPMNRTYEEMEAATAAGQLLNPKGLVLFPRERHREYHAIQIPKARIMEHSKDMGDDVLFWPELIVLISYGYNMAETPATTGLIFRIAKPRWMPFRMGESVPAEDIEVELHDMWGGFAT